MYVCICHAITDTDVEVAEKSGATEEIDVFGHFGVKPQCGRCLQSMRCLLGRKPKSCSAPAERDPAGCAPAGRRAISGA